MTQDEIDINNQSPAHDPDVLPHDYDQQDLDSTFQKAIVPDDDDAAPVCRCMCGRPSCKLCFPPRPSEFGPPAAPAEAWIASTSRLPRRIEEMRDEQPERRTLSRVVGCS